MLDTIHIQPIGERATVGSMTDVYTPELWQYSGSIPEACFRVLRPCKKEKLSRMMKMRGESGEIKRWNSGAMKFDSNCIGSRNSRSHTIPRGIRQGHGQTNNYRRQRRVSWQYARERWRNRSSTLRTCATGRPTCTGATHEETPENHLAPTSNYQSL